MKTLVATPPDPEPKKVRALATVHKLKSVGSRSQDVGNDAPKK
jgi:hypothetical protein